MLDRIRYKLIRWLARDELVIVNAVITVAPGQEKPTVYVGRPGTTCMVLGNIDARPEAYAARRGLVTHTRDCDMPHPRVTPAI